jgi:hypothetical protein
VSLVSIYGIDQVLSLWFDKDRRQQGPDMELVK